MSYAQALASRNRGLSRLREIDAELRWLCPLPDKPPGQIEYLNGLLHERVHLVCELECLGVQTWHFHPTEDKSWLPA